MVSYQSNKQFMLLFVFYLFLCYGIVELHASHPIYNLQDTSSPLPPQLNPYYQTYRTSYHFQPRQNFMNDPCGPMIYKGIYHLFYQYNPNGITFGIPVWGHSTSTDLINWTPQPIAIQPQMISNMNGSFTGSITILLPQSYTPAILFTGITPQNFQVQDLALPKNTLDPYLKEWALVPQNPLMYSIPQNQINATSFRDPSTAWMTPDGIWRVVIGSKKDRLGLALLFTSKDFINWEFSNHPLYSYPNTGMWECPDFFPVYINGSPIGVETSTFGPTVKHVLKVSLDDNKHDIYTIGTYDLARDGYTPDVGFENDSSLRYDYGKYYASKTFFDYRTKRRILLGWVNESSSLEDDMKKGWAGIHAVPRSVWLDTSGKQLIQWPIFEIETLRQNPISLTSQILQGGSRVEISGITASQADVQISFRIADYKNIEKFDTSWTDPQLLCSRMGASLNGGIGPFGLLTLASSALEEYTAVFFRLFKGSNNSVVLMCSDQSRSSLNPTTDKTTYGTFMNIDPTQDGLSMRILIDHSVIESFGGKGKGVITARVYPTIALDDKAHLYAFNNGTGNVVITSLIAWSMNKATIA